MEINSDKAERSPGSGLETGKDGFHKREMESVINSLIQRNAKNPREQAKANIQTEGEAAIYADRIIREADMKFSTRIEETKRIARSIIENAKEKAKYEAWNIIAKEVDRVREQAQRISAEVEAACQDKMASAQQQVCDILNKSYDEALELKAAAQKEADRIVAEAVRRAEELSEEILIKAEEQGRNILHEADRQADELKVKANNEFASQLPRGIAGEKGMKGTSPIKNHGESDNKDVEIFEGTVELSVHPPGALKEIRKLNRHLKSAPNIRSVFMEVSKDRGINFKISLKNPTPLIQILRELPYIHRIREVNRQDIVHRTNGKPANRYIMMTVRNGDSLLL